MGDKVLFDENPLLADFGTGNFSRLSLLSERLPVHFQILSRLFEVEGFHRLIDALPPNANFNEIRPYFGVEAIAVHAQVTWCVAEADQSRRDTAVLFHKGLHCVECLPVVDHSFCVSRK